MEVSTVEEETAESLKRRAYSIAFKLKNSGLDADVIYARLEKQGIPVDLARQVTSDLLIERKRSQDKEEEPFYHLALIKIGIGVAAALTSYIFLPDMIILPIGLILSGILYAIVSKNK